MFKYKIYIKILKIFYTFNQIFMIENRLLRVKFFSH